MERLISAVRVPDVLEDVPGRRTFVSEERHSSVTPEELSERWCIGLEQARDAVGDLASQPPLQSRQGI